MATRGLETIVSEHRRADDSLLRTIDVKCCICGEIRKRLETYGLFYKPAGEYKVRMFFVCSPCWDEEQWHEVATQIEHLGQRDGKK